MKRQRGRGRKPSNPNNRSYESNGPDVKIRGNASQIYEKYLQYARDAQTSGDRIAAEAYFQHAEHYFRIVAANTPKDRLPQMQDDQDDMTDDRSDNDDVDAKSDDSESDDVSKVDGLQVVDGDGEQPEQIKSSSDEEKKPRQRTRRPRRKPMDNAGDGASADANKGGDDAGLRNMLGKTAAPEISPEPAAEEAK